MRLHFSSLYPLALLIAASAAFSDDGSRLVTVDHYVRVKSTAPAIAGQDAHIYVREVVLAGTALRGGRPRTAWCCSCTARHAGGSRV